MLVRGHGTSRIRVIVPVKRFAGAKQRLASILSAEERACLAEHMLRDVLTTLESVQQSGVLVVTADPLAARIARSYGAGVVDDAMEAGVNSAVRQGIAALSSEPETPVAILPADVPFATPEEVSGAFAALQDESVILAPAETDGGTNLLAMCRSDLIEPCFGEQSFLRHRELALTAGLSCGVWRSEGLGCDIDRVDDLVSPRRATSTLTDGLLSEFNVAARLNGAMGRRLPRCV